MIYKYVIEQERIKGFIEIEIPKYKERINLLKTFGIVIENGEVKIGNNQIEMLEKLADIVIDKIKKVYLEVAGIDKPVTSLDDLEYYDCYGAIVNEISSAILNGVSLGNLLKRP